jgi:excisionase family DNA binding protein
MNVSIDFTDEMIERIAIRAAEFVAERNGAGDHDGFLDVDGAAAYLACPKSRIYSLVSAKRIPFHKDGSRTLFDRAELHEYVRDGGARRP